jgi:dodecin
MGGNMKEGSYLVWELAGTSAESYEKAISNAIQTASKVVNEMLWFEVTEQRGRISEGRIAEYQVVVKIGAKTAR